MSESEIPPPLPQRAISIKFTVTFFDLLKCRFWRLNHQAAFLGINLFFSSLIVFQHWNDPQTLQFAIGIRIFVSLLLAAFIYVLLISVNLLFQIILIFTNKNRGLVGAMELTVGEDGIMEKTEVSESLFRWTGFHKLRSSRNYFFLYVTQSNALYVPKRSFATNLEATQFEAAILQRTTKR